MNILVIKLGALGDVVLAFQPFADIRAYHPGGRITLLTTAPFAPLLRTSPWFDEVRIDPRPAWWDVACLLRLRRRLTGFDLVYDLQTSGRSSRYHWLAGRPEWSGIARGASLPHANPARDAMHTLERQREQLAMAGVPPGPPADLGWLVAEAPVVPAPYALLIPGAAPHRPAKRWPAKRFGELALLLARRGLNSVISGTASDTSLARLIQRECPASIDLTGRTSLPQLAALARNATLAVGNDTGPMHLAVAVGCRSIVLFSGQSDPALTAPRSPIPSQVTVVHEPDLAHLSVERVAAALP